MYARIIRPANFQLGSWKDTWNEWKDKYDSTFNPEQDPALKPAGTAITASAPAQSTFMGIPSNWLLYGGLVAIAGAAVVVLTKKTKKKSSKK